MACTKITGLSHVKRKIIANMVHSIAREDAPKEDFSIHFTDRIELQRQNSLWYNGQVAIIHYKDFMFSIEARGDIRVYLYDTENEDRQIVYVKDRSNGGALYGKLRPYLKSDAELEQAMSEDPCKYRLCIEDGNWWEVFVFDKNNEMLPNTWVAGCDEIFPAIVYVLQELDEYIAGFDESKVETR